MILDLELTHSDDEWKQKHLSTSFAFDSPTQLFLYAWLDNDLWWSKTSGWADSYRYSVFYHHCAYPAPHQRRQAIVSCTGSYAPNSTLLETLVAHEDIGSRALLREIVRGTTPSHAMIEHCIVPIECEPVSSVRSEEISLLTPCTFFSRNGHGLGMIVVPQGCAKNLRNHIWRLKSEYLSAPLRPFAESLHQGRHGHLTGSSPGQDGQWK